MLVSRQVALGDKTCQYATETEFRGAILATDNLLTINGHVYIHKLTAGNVHVWPATNMWLPSTRRPILGNTVLSPIQAHCASGN